MWCSGRLCDCDDDSCIFRVRQRHVVAEVGSYSTCVTRILMCVTTALLNGQGHANSNLSGVGQDTQYLPLVHYRATRSGAFVPWLDGHSHKTIYGVNNKHEQTSTQFHVHPSGVKSSTLSLINAREKLPRQDSAAPCQVPCLVDWIHAARQSGGRHEICVR